MSPAAPPLPDLADFFPAGVECEAQAVRMPAAEETTPAERACVAGAAPKRQREFLSGRIAARRALARLGITACELLPDPAGGPRWPPEVVGSISHSGALCLAAVAPRAQLAGLGVDCEPDDPLDAALWPRIITPAELAWIGRQPEAERGRWVRLFFSAKEAAYKYQHPLTRNFVGFQELTLILDPPAGTFALRSHPRVPELDEARGAWRRSAGQLVSWVAGGGLRTGSR